MAHATETYEAHLEKFRKSAHIRTLDQYRSLHRESIIDPDRFWARQAVTYLSWEKKWNKVHYADYENARFEWFSGGILNACHNCIDRHLQHSPDKIAFYWEGDDPLYKRTVTYRNLYQIVNKLASLLLVKGVRKGDVVAVYMPMIPELPAAMLACARIGAIHTVVSSEFSAKALSSRLQDCGATAIITADRGYRGGRIFFLKENVDIALAQSPFVETVVVFMRNPEKPLPRSPGEVRWHEIVSDPAIPEYVAPVPMDSEDPLFILFTSGSTAKPKALLHTHGGYLLYAAITTRLVFDIRGNEIFWCTGDMGWITGHSYGVYGPLLNNMTSVIFEGIPGYPDHRRFYDILSRYQVDTFYSTPTIIRELAREGDSHLEGYNLSSLRLLGSVGEPISPETWKWYYNVLGKGRCPVIDTYWQTETGGHVLTPMPGVAPLKPGFCSFPFFGIDPVILDDTGDKIASPEQEGVLCIKKPWPGMARSIYGNHDLFVDTYFRQAPEMYFSSDAARIDDEGHFRIIGRVDEVINVAGYRFGTAEIESALMEHQSVAEVAVVGHPHPIKVQGIYAFVTLRPGIQKTETLKTELAEMVLKEIGVIASVDMIQWADALPKTRSGKIVRRILSKVASGQTEDLGDTTGLSDPAVIQQLIQGHI